MSRILVDIREPEWWFAVVMVSLLVNLASGYLKSYIDRRFDRFSRLRSARSQAKREAKQKAMAEYVSRAVQHDWFRTAEMIRMFQLESRATSVSLAGVGALIVSVAILVPPPQHFNFGLPSFLLFVTGAVLVRLGARHHEEAMRIAIMLEFAYRRIGDSAAAM